jgi:cell division protein ZapA
MCAIRDSGKIKGTDRIAVMAALGMSAEFLAARTAPGGSAALSSNTQAEVRSQITAMHALLDSALAPQEKLF